MTKQIDDEIREAGCWPTDSVPSTWEWRSFRDVFQNVTDGQRKVPQVEYLLAGPYAVVDQGKDLIGGYTDQDSLVHPDQPPFLVFGDHTRCIKFVGFPFVQGADGIKVLKAQGGVDPQYAFWLLRAIRLPDKGYSRHYKYLTASRFPLPPHAVQKALASTLDELFTDLDAGMAALERVRANLKRYRAAVLKAAVEGRLTEEWRETHAPAESAEKLLARILAERRKKWEAAQLAKFAAAGKTPPKGWQSKYDEPTAPDTSSLPELPKGWCWATFEQAATEVTVGFVGPMKNEYVSSGIPFLRSQNVRPLRYDGAGLKYISTAFHQRLSKSRLTGGELLVVRSGTIGDACVYPEDAPEGNCSDLVITRLTAGVNGKYAAIYVNSPGGGLAVGAKKTGIALTHFNVGAMEISPFPVPPLAEQSQIVAEVERRLSVADEVEAQLDANLKRAARLRQAILKKAFEGDL